MPVAQLQWMVSPSGSVMEVSLDQVSTAIGLGYKPLGSPVEWGAPDPVYGTASGQVGKAAPESTLVEKTKEAGLPLPVKSGAATSGDTFFNAQGIEVSATDPTAAFRRDASGAYFPYSAPKKDGKKTTTGGTTMPVTTPQDVLSEADLYGQYLNQFNIPAFGASPFQKWQARQAAPTLGAYVLQSQQNPNLALADYLGQTGIMGARQQLPGAYNALMANPDRGVVDWARQSLGELWNDVMGGVTSAKYGRFFGPQLAQALPQMQRQFEATPAGFAAPGESSFLDYLRQRYGI